MSKFLKNLKINTKFTIIIMIVFGLFLATMALVLENTFDNLTRLIGQQRVQEESEVIKSQLDTATQELLLAAKLIATAPSVIDRLQARDYKGIRTHLLIEAAPFALDELDVVDGQGNLLETGMEYGELPDPGETDLLSLALLGVETTGITQEEEEEGAILRLSATVPIKDSLGNIIGGLVASRDIDDNFLARLNFNRTDVHLLLVSKNQVVAQDVIHNDDNITHENYTSQIPVSFASILDKADLAQAQQGHTVIADDFVRLDTDSADHSLAYLPLDIQNNFGAVLVILSNLETLSSFQTELTLNLLVLVAIMAVVAIGVTVLLAKYSLISPLTRLANVSHQMAAGDLHIRMGVDSNDEIGLLGHAFNSMANQLQQTLTGLEQRVAERTTELRTTNYQLRQEITQRQQIEQELIQARDQALEASRLKTELLAKVSHELRTPLSAIWGYAELLQLGTYGDVSNKQEAMLGEIIKSAQYQTTLVNELLDQAQLDAGRLKLEISNFAPTEIIDGALAKMQPLAKAKELNLLVHIADNMPANLRGDLTRLQQILLNLVGNAIKFTESGRVQVNLSRCSPTHWSMQVSDTGPGISAEAQVRIFEPFGQVDGSATRQHRGTGLGLSIVKQLVTLMGGQIKLESEFGQGSTFTVMLPIHISRQETDVEIR